MLSEHTLPFTPNYKINIIICIKHHRNICFVRFSLSIKVLAEVNNFFFWDRGSLSRVGIAKSNRLDRPRSKTFIVKTKQQGLTSLTIMQLVTGADQVVCHIYIRCIASIWRANMLEFCPWALSVPRREQFSESVTVSFEEHNVQFIILQIFFATLAVLKIGVYSRIFPNFSWGIFSHLVWSFSI